MLLFEQKRYLEQFIAQFVDGSSVDESVVFHDVKDSIAHFDFDAHLEPLVIDVKTGTKFSSKVKAFRDEVINEFIAITIGFLVVLL